MEPVPTFTQNDPSSFTQESLSLQATERFSVRQEDAEKFVSRWDQEAVSCTDVTKKVAKLQQTLTKTTLELKTIQDAIQWRKSAAKDFQTFEASLKTIEETLDKLSRKLNGSIGVCKQIATVHETSAIPTIIKSILALQMQLLLAQKQTTSLKSLTEAGHVIEAYTSVKQVMPSLFEVVADQSADKVDRFIETTDGIIKQYAASIHPELNEIFEGNPTKTKIDAFVQKVKSSPPNKAESKQENIKLHARQELAREMLRVSCVIANAIFENKKKTKTNQRLSWRTTLLTALIDHASSGLQKKPPQKPAATPVYSEAIAQAQTHNSNHPIEKPEHVAHLLENEVVTKEALQELKEPINQLSFWPVTGKSSYWYTVAGYYPRTGALATAMDEDVAAILSGIVLKIKRHLAAFANLEYSLLAEAEGLQDALKHYWRCLEELETTFDRYFEQLCRTPFDDLTQNVLDYAHGLRTEFYQARSLIKLAHKCTLASSQAVFEAARTLEEPLSRREYPSELERTLGLYYASLAMKQAANAQPKNPAKPFDTLLSHTIDLLNEVHAKKDPQLLALSDKEQQVLYEIFSQKPIILNSAAQDAIMNFISKRITRFFFLPAEAHDMELELLLFAIKSNQTLQTLFTESLKNPRFDQLIRTYLATYIPQRLPDNQLSQALEIASYVSASNVLTATKGQQLFFEFCKSYEGPAAVALQKVLAGYMETVSTKNGYDPIYEIVAKRDIETWKIEGKPPQEFLSEISEACVHLRSVLPNIEEQHVFNAVLVRLLAASIYATNIEEQLLAQRQLLSIFASDAYAPFLSALSSTTKQLITKSTIEKILNCSFDEDELAELALPQQEFAFLLNGPIKQFFAHEAVESTEIEMVLYKLITGNPQDEALKNRFIQSKGKSKFYRWMTDFELFTNMNHVTQVVLKLKSEGVELWK